ncbi:hypothetical protein SASPL_157445 [Salvia splendens]|uniref:Uncharacterized protein n=1 Tax=Salvia splendens TaxID=180675 RepID=A0A8X8VV03_SALSN|nr:hypothetical protein SASPL_157445 [Salvia splendens]
MITSSIIIVCHLISSSAGKKRKTYSAFAIFSTQQKAIKAFENIDGELEKVCNRCLYYFLDSCGRPQKLVKFELDSGTTGSFYVCKIVADNSVGDEQRRGQQKMTVLGQRKSQEQMKLWYSLRILINAWIIAKCI